MSDFSPITATLGGLLIGAAAMMLLLLNGRIAGISGILNGAFGRNNSDRSWRLFFIAGLLLGTGIYQIINGKLDVVIQQPLWLLIFAGVLVGFGTRLGSGCTSGHGVCGIGRGSIRSVVATVTFMSFAIASTYVSRHLLGLGHG